MADLLSLVKELNSLTFKELSEKVIKDSEVEWCLSELQDMLEADCVPVVRCKDCKSYREFRTKRYKQVIRLCCRMGKHDMEYHVKPDDFCSYGERGEGAEW